MKKCTLTLPWPPSVNHYKQAGRLVTTKTGKIYQQRIDTQETKRFYFEVWHSIYKLKLKQGLVSFADATISVEIDLCPPDYRKFDIDNRCKVLLDSMQRASLYDDDHQVARLLVQRMPIIANGQVIVRIEEMTKEFGNGTR